MNRVVETCTAVKDVDDSKVTMYDSMPVDWIEPSHNKNTSEVIINLLSICPHTPAADTG
jgi:hypothetical protein